MRKLSFAALGVVAAIALAGCASGAPAEAETGDIRVWLVGTDTPQDARDYLKTTFEKENPGSTLTIEEQAWPDDSREYADVATFGASRHAG